MQSDPAKIAAGLSEAYRWGWDWAALGMELHAWLLPHFGTTQVADVQRGFDDFRAHLKGTSDE